MKRLYIIHVIVIVNIRLLIFRGGRRGYQCLSVNNLSFRNSMIPFKNLLVNCRLPLLAAKMSSINDTHLNRILASLLSLKNIVLDLAITGA